jgi:hypothetical protein
MSDPQIAESALATSPNHRTASAAEMAEARAILRLVETLLRQMGSELKAPSDSSSTCHDHQ